MPAVAEPETAQRATLLIGWGNDLRGDDGAGRRVAEAFADSGHANLTALSVHQLTPELAHTISLSDRVIFVDAYPAQPGWGVTCRHLRLADEDGGAGVTPHAATPERMLAAAATLYDARPEAWLIGVPAHRFELGTELTAQTRGALADALACIDNLLGEAQA